MTIAGKSKEYYAKNPSYHVEDAEFKWNNFEKAILLSKIDFSKANSIGEIGCGSGQILSFAKKSGLSQQGSWRYYYAP